MTNPLEPELYYEKALQHFEAMESVAEKTKAFGKRVKLTEKDVQLVRFFLKAGIPIARIAKTFKASYFTIKNIETGKTWSRLDYEIPLNQLQESASTANPYVPQYYLYLEDGYSCLTLNNRGSIELVSKDIHTEQAARGFIELVLASDAEYQLEINDQRGKPVKP